MRKAKTAADEEISFAEAFAMLKPVVEKALAERPPSPEPAPAWRAETAAERDLFRAEMACRIQAVICSNPARCAKHACRRLRRCPELEDCQRLVEEQRALVARERAALPAADAAMPCLPITRRIRPHAGVQSVGDDDEATMTRVRCARSRQRKR